MTLAFISPPFSSTEWLTRRQPLEKIEKMGRDAVYG